MVYNDASLDYILTPEGKISYTTSGFTYNYFKKDHVGSTRAVLAASGGTLQAQQTTDYYPFGLAWATNDLNRNKLLFGGKELQDNSIGDGMLGFYDFGARFYNPEIGRWFNVDPKLQLLNPYLYCMNSPVSYFDRDGQWIGLLIGGFALAGAYLGGASANHDWNPFRWDWGSGATWGGFLGGAVKGAVDGLALGYGLTAAVPGLSVLGRTMSTASTVGRICRGMTLAFNYAKVSSTMIGMIKNPDHASRILMGDYYMNPRRTVGGQIWQGFRRSTWERWQQTVGYTYSQVRNMMGNVTNVDLFDGAVLVNRDVDVPRQHGVTLGNMINGLNMKANTSDVMFMHEYGHTVQGGRFGPSYLFAVGIPSVFSASGSEQKHAYRWYERQANSFASDYFGRHHGIDWNDILNDRRNQYNDGSSKYPLY